jgi:hypothetical protein
MTARTAVSLIRYHPNSEAAELDHATGDLAVIKRHRSPDGKPPHWLPDVPLDGWFDYLGGLLVAVYRIRGDAGALWLRLGDRRFAFSEALRSEFSPQFPDQEPLVENVGVLRTLQLFEGDQLVAEHQYRLHDGTKPLERSIDPFPSWPEEEEDYDLLYFVHRIMIGERWRRVLQHAQEPESEARPAREPRSTPPHPWTVTALSLFFGFGTLMSFLSFVALLFPGGFLEPMWRLNPRARENFATMGLWGPLLMLVVSFACASAAIGLWRGKRFGYVLGLTLLIVSLLGDLANAVLGIEPRAWIGVPIAALLIWVLATGRARAFFEIRA